MVREFGKKFRLLIIVVLVSFTALVSSQENSTIVQESTSDFVYLIRASDCKNNESYTGTAFELEGLEGLVTALHLVVECSSYTAQNHRLLNPIPLKLTNVDISLDVAFLSALNDEYFLAESGFKANSAIIANAPVIVIGYPLGVGTQLDSRGNIFLRNRPYIPLIELLPKDAPFVPDLIVRNSPDTSKPVLSINGVTLHGHSGAPILYQDRTLVGMVNGGIPDYLKEVDISTLDISNTDLDQLPSVGSITGISWGIPWKDVIPTSTQGANDEISSLAEQSASNLIGLSSNVLRSRQQARENLVRISSSMYNREAASIDPDLLLGLISYFENNSAET